ARIDLSCATKMRQGFGDAFGGGEEKADLVFVPGRPGRFPRQRGVNADGLIDFSAVRESLSIRFGLGEQGNGRKQGERGEHSISWPPHLSEMIIFAKNSHLFLRL